jgi:hypothetical protein
MSVFNNFLSDLKYGYSTIGDGTVHMNNSLFGVYIGEAEQDNVSFLVEGVKEESDTPTLPEDEAELTLMKRFTNTWRGMGDGFTLAKSMSSSVVNDLDLSETFFWAAGLIISLMIALKVGLGFLLDR